jgi:hypothetical protein
VSDVQPGGHRRIDRVLAEEFVADLRSLPIEELRARRHEAEQEEVDLSYLRRLLQGRTDIVRAELARRGSHEGGSVVEHLTEILSDDTAAPTHGLGRYTTLEPSRADSHRRRVEALVADVDLTDVSARSDEELRRVLETYQHEEHATSEQRRAVQQVMDRCSAEVARRYRDGEADVADLLAGEGG